VTAMRVAVLIDGLGWGGAETLLADFAAGAGAAGLELHVGYLIDKEGSPAAQRLRERGVEPVHVPVRGLVDPGSLLAVRRHLREVAPDVVHTHLGYADLLGGVAARSLGLPVVSTIHVTRWDDGGRERLKLRLMDLARAGCARRIICVSEAARAAFLGARRGPPRRVVVVPNGVQGRPADAAAAARVRAELGVGADDVVLTMLSVLRPGKGHEAAFTAVARLRADGLPVVLVVCGTGPSEHALRDAAAPLGAAVRFAGHRDDVMAVLAASDVVVHPSEHEALPTALIEAAAASRPVVATRVGGIPEIVQDGAGGILVPAPAGPAELAAALAALVGDRERREQLGAAARARFEERFAADRWAAAVREVYRVAGAAS